MAGYANTTGPPAGTLTQGYLKMHTASAPTLAVYEQPPHTNEITQGDAPIPSRQDRPGKRESRLNIRGLFTRRLKKEGMLSGQESLEIDSTSVGGSSTSLIDTPHLLYGSNASLPISLPQSSTNSLLIPGSLTTPYSHGGRDSAGDLRSGKRSSNSENSRLQMSAAGIPWPPPLLFQAYEQSIKHSIMSTCTLSTETLERINRSSVASSARKTSDASDLSMKKRLNRNTLVKNPIEVVSKVYVLTTANYLFQYAADGEDDRPPERALRITKQSAAFASDLIPGRHWVIQVQSDVDEEATRAIDMRTRRSRLSLKNSEKRPPSSFLLVCQSPEDMESWLAVIRHEIAILGGKQQVSETGNLIGIHSNASDLQVETGHYNDVRYSRIIREDFSWNQDNSLSLERLERTPELLQDDESTTASLISSEGHRDSTGHRYSVQSMECRVMGTPPNSSPACSPSRLTFASFTNDVYSIDPKSHPETRVRPNAAAISERRRSRQSASTDMDVYYPSSRKASIDSTRSVEHEYVSAPHNVPNFSVPQATGRRFSSQTPVITTDQPPPPSPPQIQGPTLPRAARRAPPTALPLSRPLSVVIDQPSPLSPAAAIRQLSQIPEKSAARFKSTTRQIGSVLGEGPRKFVSLSNLRAGKAPPQPDPSLSMLRLDPVQAMERAMGLSPTVGHFDSAVQTSNVTSRSSMTVEFNHPANNRYSEGGEMTSLNSALQSMTTSSQNEPRTQLVPARLLTTQKSMPVLTNMPPPPAPPPNRALPPLPPKHAPPTCALPPIPAKAPGRQFPLVSNFQETVVI